MIPTTVLYGTANSPTSLRLYCLPSPFPTLVSRRREFSVEMETRRARALFQRGKPRSPTGVGTTSCDSTAWFSQSAQEPPSVCFQPNCCSQIPPRPRCFIYCAYMFSSRLYEGNLSVDGMNPQKSYDEKKVRIS